MSSTLIQQNNLFATPNDMQSLQTWIMAHNGGERTAAVVAAGMAWNLAHKILADHEERMNQANEQVSNAQMAEADPDGTQMNLWDQWHDGAV